jgi:hypothetical protein
LSQELRMHTIPLPLRCPYFHVQSSFLKQSLEGQEEHKSFHSPSKRNSRRGCLGFLVFPDIRSKTGRRFLILTFLLQLPGTRAMGKCTTTFVTIQFFFLVCGAVGGGLVEGRVGCVKFGKYPYYLYFLLIGSKGSCVHLLDLFVD